MFQFVLSSEEKQLITEIENSCDISICNHLEYICIYDYKIIKLYCLLLLCMGRYEDFSYYLERVVDKNFVTRAHRSQIMENLTVIRDNTL